MNSIIFDKATEFLLYAFGVCILILGLFHMTSCAPVEKVERDDFNRCIREVEYKGHKYLKYDKFQTHTIVHDPNCPCMTNKVEAAK